MTSVSVIQILGSAIFCLQEHYVVQNSRVLSAPTDVLMSCDAEIQT